MTQITIVHMHPPRSTAEFQDSSLFFTSRNGIICDVTTGDLISAARPLLALMPTIYKFPIVPIHPLFLMPDAKPKADAELFLTLSVKLTAAKRQFVRHHI